jgi:hypothetical protein
VVYYTPTTECYRCIQATAAEKPDNALFWEKQNIPAIFETYLVNAGFAETLMNDGNARSADRENARAQAELERVYERQILATAQGGRARVRVSY